MKLLVDMNLSARWAEFFSSHGIEAIHWTKIGAATDSDDLDFSAILSQTGASKPSVIQLRHERPRVAEFGPIMLRVIAENRDSLETGALLVVEPLRHRIRILAISYPS